MQGFVDNYIKSEGGWSSTLQLMSNGDIINFEGLNGDISSSSSEAVFGSVTTLEISSADFCMLASKYPQLYQSILSRILSDKNTLLQMYACLK